VLKTDGPFVYAGAEPGPNAMRLPRHPRILIVDDSIVVRRILAFTVSQMHELWGATVEEAGNGAIALKKLAQAPFDLVLSDIRMPYVDGFEMLRVARTEMGLTIPIVLISTLGTEADVRRGMEAGATAYILKPLSPHHIKVALRELLEEPEGPPS
jgi:two-component system, chemotaxis family, chemotaxis protein CheY